LLTKPPLMCILCSNSTEEATMYIKVGRYRIYPEKVLAILAGAGIYLWHPLVDRFNRHVLYWKGMRYDFRSTFQNELFFMLKGMEDTIDVTIWGYPLTRVTWDYKAGVRVERLSPDGSRYLLPQFVGRGGKDEQGNVRPPAEAHGHGGRTAVDDEEDVHEPV